MPNTNISLYLTDDEYIKYVKVKRAINQKVREMIKEELGGKNG